MKRGKENGSSNENTRLLHGGVKYIPPSPSLIFIRFDSVYPTPRKLRNSLLETRPNDRRHRKYVTAADIENEQVETERERIVIVGNRRHREDVTGEDNGEK